MSFALIAMARALGLRLYSIWRKGYLFCSVFVQPLALGLPGTTAMQIVNSIKAFLANMTFSERWDLTISLRPKSGSKRPDSRLQQDRMRLLNGPCSPFGEVWFGSKGRSWVPSPELGKEDLTLYKQWKCILLNAASSGEEGSHAAG